MTYLCSERLHQSIEGSRSDRQVHAHETPADSQIVHQVDNREQPRLTLQLQTSTAVKPVNIARSLIGCRVTVGVRSQISS